MLNVQRAGYGRVVDRLLLFFHFASQFTCVHNAHLKGSTILPSQSKANKVYLQKRIRAYMYEPEHISTNLIEIYKGMRKIEHGKQKIKIKQTCIYKSVLRKKMYAPSNLNLKEIK